MDMQMENAHGIIFNPHCGYMTINGVAHSRTVKEDSVLSIQHRSQ